jgi:hypothetical protein
MKNFSTHALLLSVLLGCGGGNRSTSPLVFPGDPEDAIAAVEAEIAERGFDPKCKARAFCVFEMQAGVRVHIKVAKDRLALLVDVDDAEALGPERERELRQKAETLGREIWAKASPRAVEDVRVAKAAAAKREAAEAEQARRDEENAPKDTAKADELREMMDRVQQGTRSESNPSEGSPTDSGSSGGVTVETRCCVNKQFLDCPMSDCAGLGKCLMDCMDSRSSGCEDACTSKYTASCKRVPSRDLECVK